MFPDSDCRDPSARLPKVLIVDDVPQVRQDLWTLLELSGAMAVVGEAANGQEAIVQVEKLRPEIVLMDLEMPLMDGFEAARSIKARWPSCRVIAFSVHSDPLAREKARRAGVDGFVEKGASLAEMLRNMQAPATNDFNT